MDGETWYRACQEPDLPTQTAAFTTLFVYLSRVALHIVYDQPGAETLAQDCAQTALIRIHQRLAECREPAAFRTWSRQIVSHIAIDTLRRRARLTFAYEDELDTMSSSLAAEQPTLEEQTAATLHTQALHTAIQSAPISDRSRRVVIGRYLQELPDEVLATLESKLTGVEMLPSHIQVTRSKNIAKLRQWPPLLDLLAGSGKE
jgi:RNA polymerase sigma factor (sigma-70 family)